MATAGYYFSMTYDAKSQWRNQLANDMSGVSYPAQGLVRTIKGNYPNLTPIPKGLKVLDLGCGDGRNAKFLADEGFDVSGIEIDSETCLSLREKHPEIDFFEGTSANLPFDDLFDLIVAWNSIYYMGSDQHEVLLHFKECRRVLRKNEHSRLILSIPMPTSFIFQDSTLLRESHGVEYRVITKDPYNIRVGEILALFPNLQNLTSILEASGFSQLEVGEEMGDWFGRKYDWWIVSARLSDFS